MDMNSQERKEGRQLSPETEAIHGGYDPMRSEGAAKVPLFATSTFVAENAQDLANSFIQAYGLDGNPRNPDSLIYSRLVNPNPEIFETRIAKFEEAEEAALFASGMASITSTCLTFLKPGMTVLASSPVYGGTDFLLKKFLSAWGVGLEEFLVQDTAESVKQKAADIENLGLVFIETPANPTLQLADLPGIIEGIREVAPNAIIAVDNTLLGPVFQKVLPLGADLAIFSATKMIGGHSDLIAGLVMGKTELIGKIKGTRTISGTMNDPHAAWLLTRSLETLKVRAEAAEAKAKKVHAYLVDHPLVDEVFYPGFSKDDEQNRRYESQCSGHGSLMSFLVKGGKDEAYKVLNSLNVIKLAVSLGGTESLAEHPRSHTHADVSEEDQNQFGITENLIRLSVGLEDADDLIADLEQALS